jgi:hypothetical protein
MLNNPTFNYGDFATVKIQWGLHNLKLIALEFGS